MKVYVLDELSRTVLLTLTYILQLAYIFIFVSSVMCGDGSADRYVVSAIMLLQTAALTIYVTLLCFAAVTIDGNGVTLHTGKLVFNSVAWNRLERIVLVELLVKGLRRRLGISLVLKDKQGKIEPNRVTLNIFNKRAIVLAYNKQTYNIIKNYYSAWIENEHLIYDYYDDGIEKRR